MLLKVILNRPTFNNTVEGDNVVGSATLKINYLLNQSGAIIIPEQTITWFNTQTGKKTKATLPARTLQVTPEPGTSSSTPSPTPPKTTPPTTLDTQKALPSMQNHSFFHGLIFHITLLSAFLLLSLFCFILRKKQMHQRKHLKKLKKACLSNQSLSTRNALLTWSKHTWPDANLLNLDDIIKLASDTPLTEAIHALSKALYHPEQTIPWQGSNLWSAIQTLNTNHRHLPPKENPLPPINPRH